MAVHAFPSDPFPAPPGFQITSPDEWEALADAGSLLAVAAPLVPDRFRSNVVVTWSRRPAGTNADEVLAEVVQRYRAEDEMELAGTAEAESGGLQARLCEVAFRLRDAGTIVQTSMIVTAPGGGVTDVIIATGSCAGTELATELPVLRDIVRSLEIG